MRKFTNLETAKSYAAGCTKIALVFHGPEGGYIVAIGRDARALLADGHVAYSLKDTAKVAH